MFRAFRDLIPEEKVKKFCKRNIFIHNAHFFNCCCSWLLAPTGALVFILVCYIPAAAATAAMKVMTDMNVMKVMKDMKVMANGTSSNIMSERHGVLWTPFFIISISYICFGLLFERFLFLAWSIQPPTLLSILLLWPSKETNQEDPKKAMQCCNRRLLEFSEIVGKERVQVTFSLELALF